MEYWLVPSPAHSFVAKMPVCVVVGYGNPNSLLTPKAVDGTAHR